MRNVYTTDNYWMVNKRIEQQSVEISKGVAVYATDMLLHFVVKWEWSVPEGNADLFFKGNQSDILYTSLWLQK